MLRPPRPVVATATVLAWLLVHTAAQVPGDIASAPVVVIVRLEAPPVPEPDEPEAIDLLDSSLTPQGRDLKRAQRDAGLVSRIEAASRVPRDNVTRLIEASQGRVLSSLRAVNALVAEVPSSQVASLRMAPGVAAVLADEPRQAHLDITGQSLRVPEIWQAGYTGGATDVAVVDTGLYGGHAAFASRSSAVTGAVFHDAAQRMSNYWDLPDDPDDFAGHGTFVAGLVFSQGDPTNRSRLGVAHGIDRFYNIKAGYLTYPHGGSSLLSDLMAGVDWALTRDDPPEVFNYSYGAQVAFDDDAYTRFWDGVVDTFGKTATISAGNGGPGAVSSPGTAYNVISVANIDAMGTPSRTDDTIAETSSGGPTPGGRRKPDLSAPGTNVWMPSHYGALLWQRATGTSFAAPAVAGVAALLIDTGITDPRAVKALLINTADPVGPMGGWDPRAGWGQVNAARAFEERHDVRLLSVPASGPPLRASLFERRSGAPTRATIAWHRHVRYDIGDAVEPNPLNNIDLYLYSRDSGELRAASTSTIDNVERVSSALTEGAVLAVVGAEPFTGAADTVALAHSGGFVARAGPAVTVALDTLTSPTPASTFTVTAVVRNSGDLRSSASEATIVLPPGIVLAQGAARQALGALEAGAHATVTWFVRAPLTPTTASTISVTARVSGYGLTWDASTIQAIMTATGCGYSVMPRTLELSASGTENLLDVAAPPGCSWDAASSESWAALSPPTGMGSGGVVVQVDENTGKARTATILVAGQPVVVSQASGGGRTYYLAEGSTRAPFTQEVAIANPNDAGADVRVIFHREAEAPREQHHTVAPRSRITLSVDDMPGLEASDVSTVVESLSGLPLAVERTMMWDGDGYGGHGGSAVEQPSTTWYFAEGSQGFFDTFLLLANPGTTATDATVRYLREDDAPVQRTYRVEAHGRLTVYAGADEALRGRAFSIVVEAETPVVAERSMYWSNHEVFWVGGHESAGVPAPSATWFLAEGATGPFFDDYVLVSNPNQAPAELMVRWLLATGEVVESRKTIAAQRRLTIDVEREDPRLSDAAVSASVVASQPVVVERAMYWPGSPGEWQEAHNAFGVTALETRWALAEGRVGLVEGYETYILLANPTPDEAIVRVTFLREQESPVVKTFVVPPTSRRNIVVSNDAEISDAPELRHERFGADIEVVNGIGIAVERAMYWNSRGRVWAGGTSVTAIRLP